MAGSAKPNWILGNEVSIVIDSSSVYPYGDKANTLIDGVVETTNNYGIFIRKNNDYIIFTINEKCNIYSISAPKNSAYNSSKNVYLYKKNTSGNFDLVGEYSTVSETERDWFLLFPKLNSGTYKVTAVADNYVTFTEWFAESLALNLIKKDNAYYSIKEENYDSTNQIYNLITDLTIDNFNDYGFSIEELFTENTIGTETFKPIDKFDNFQLISLKDTKYNLNAIKYKREMSIANGDFSIRLAENIDFFNSESSIGTNCSIKVALSKDSGVTWLSTSDNGITWDILTNTVPMKAYSELTDEEKIQWNNLMNEVFTNGINLTDLNSIDFNTLDADKLRFAYVFDINHANDVNTITKLQWQFDSIGDYEQMNNDTDVNIAITNNTIKIKPLKDYELMKINVGVSSSLFDINSLTDSELRTLKAKLDALT